MEISQATVRLVQRKE